MNWKRLWALRCRLFVLAALIQAVCLVHSSTLKTDERVVLYPALAAPVKGGWEIQVHGLVYEPEQHQLTTALIRRLAGLEEETLTPAEVDTFRQRISYFLVDNERRKKVAVWVGGEKFQLGTSGANGHFQTDWRWKTNEPALALLMRQVTNEQLHLELFVEGAQRNFLPMQVHLVSETGLSVISDLDDTIKVSQVRDRKALLLNTFCRPFQPVPGMADVYQEWQRREAAQFHYVTASPWQLYLPLADFAQSNGFPAGTFHMKQFRLKDESVKNLFVSPERYKPRIIEPLLQQFPKREFVLVGDSGEKDPEVYGEIARKYPKQIRHIFIRDVTDERDNSPRYTSAFRQVPRGTWQIFTDPAEIKEALVPRSPP